MSAIENESHAVTLGYAAAPVLAEAKEIQIALLYTCTQSRWESGI